MKNLIADTNQGLIEGVEEEGLHIWRGVPFAEPPVGELRLKPPVLPTKWKGIRKAKAYGPICSQNFEPTVISTQPLPDAQSEDCLYLNIWAPKSLNQPTPVMVWIHGGAFRSGGGSIPFYNGARLAKQGQVIVVTLNYRLGAFGFLPLASLDDRFEANLGLQDQIIGLKWIQENIGAFGGDPNQVTIFGESAGSMSIAALLAMPEARGLFQQAIMESGASSFLPSDLAKHITQHFIHELGASQDLSLLTKATTEEFLEAAKQTEEQFNYVGMVFQPIIDPKTLPLEPTQAVAEGSAEGVRLLIGTNHDEGSFFFRSGGNALSEEGFLKALTRFAGAVKAEQLSQIYPANIDGQGQMMTDFVFWIPALRFAENQTKHAPVYMYRFDWTLKGHPILGKAIHAIEIPFVFNNLEFFQLLKIPVDSTIEQLSNEIQNAWVSFAKTGTPQVSTEIWPAYNLEKRPTLVFDNELRIENDPYREKRKQILV